MLLLFVVLVDFKACINWVVELSRWSSGKYLRIIQLNTFLLLSIR